MAEGKWTVKVHPDTGKYPPLGHRATVYTPEGNPLFYAVDLPHGFERALYHATESEAEDWNG